MSIRWYIIAMMLVGLTVASAAVNQPLAMVTFTGMLFGHIGNGLYQIWKNGV